jgi:hypothetical protein
LLHEFEKLKAPKKRVSTSPTAISHTLNERPPLRSNHVATSPQLSASWSSKGQRSSKGPKEKDNFETAAQVKARNKQSRPKTKK